MMEDLARTFVRYDLDLALSSDAHRVAATSPPGQQFDVYRGGAC